MRSDQKRSKTMNIIPWIAQGLVGITLMWTGIMKLFKPEQLPFPWIKDNANLVWLTAIIDLLAGIGIILPALLNIKPKLTIYAAYGTIALMIAASIFHISRNETKDIGFNICMAIIALFIVWGRTTKAQVLPHVSK